MFVYSVRASTIKFFSVIVLTLLALVGILVFGSSADDSVYTLSGNIDFSGVKTNEDRIDFISRESPSLPKAFPFPKISTE